jgi:hypothetical protein
MRKAHAWMTVPVLMAATVVPTASATGQPGYRAPPPVDRWPDRGTGRACWAELRNRRREEEL